MKARRIAVTCRGFLELEDPCNEKSRVHFTHRTARDFLQDTKLFGATDETGSIASVTILKALIAKLFLSFHFGDVYEIWMATRRAEVATNKAQTALLERLNEVLILKSKSVGMSIKDFYKKMIRRTDDVLDTLIDNNFGFLCVAACFELRLYVLEILETRVRKSTPAVETRLLHFICAVEDGGSIFYSTQKQKLVVPLLARGAASNISFNGQTSWQRFLHRLYEAVLENILCSPHLQKLGFPVGIYEEMIITFLNSGADV